jgi:hypothetical protein
MTKVTFIGQEPTKKSKHIELVETFLHSNVAVSAEDWGNCQLLKRNARKGMDLIFCYDDTGDVLYLGHWNDGTTSNPDTVCTVLGEDVEVKKGKGIEFVKQLNSKHNNLSFLTANYRLDIYENIEVIRYGKEDCLDLFFAYKDDRNDGFLFLGHLNDGFVE